MSKLTVEDWTPAADEEEEEETSADDDDKEEEVTLSGFESRDMAEGLKWRNWSLLSLFLYLFPWRRGRVTFLGDEEEDDDDDDKVGIDFLEMEENPQTQSGLGAFFFNLWEKEINPEEEYVEPRICIALSIINFYTRVHSTYEGM